MKNKHNNMFGQLAEIVNLIGKARGLALDSGFDLEVTMLPTTTSKQSVAVATLDAEPTRRKRHVPYQTVLKRRQEIRDQLLTLIKEAGPDGISAKKLASRLRLSGQKVGQNLRHLATEAGTGVVLVKTPKGRIATALTVFNNKKSQG